MVEGYEESSGAAHVVVLLSDGIVDPSHAREAARKASSLHRRLHKVAFFALVSDRGGGGGSGGAWAGGTPL